MTKTREPVSPADGARLPVGQTHLTPRPIHWTNLPVPNAAERRAAWDGLSDATKARIGALAVEIVFQSFLAADAYSPNGAAAPDQASRDVSEERSSDALDELHTVTEVALPQLFGEPAGYPAWAVQH